MARTNPKQGKSFVRWFLKKIGLSAPASRRVSFHEQATVVEFERQLNGGGGVPDGDAVALGLGPRCAFLPVPSPPATLLIRVSIFLPQLHWHISLSALGERRQG